MMLGQARFLILACFLFVTTLGYRLNDPDAEALESLKDLYQIYKAHQRRGEDADPDQPVPLAASDADPNEPVPLDVLEKELLQELADAGYLMERGDEPPQDDPEEPEDPVPADGDRNQAIRQEDDPPTDVDEPEEPVPVPGDTNQGERSYWVRRGDEPDGPVPVEDIEDTDLDLQTRDLTVEIYGVNLDDFADSHPAKKLRTGQAGHDHGCNSVTAVPAALRDKKNMWPSGIQNFYTKYTQAYGIPILGSRNVTDEGLRRACYEMYCMLASNYAIRNAVYKMYGRVSIIGDGEQQTTLPEYKNLDSGYWDRRARGLGGSMGNPTTSVGDDNLRCAAQNGGKDRYRDQDILSHEFGHSVHMMGAEFVVKGFARRIRETYERAKAAGRWKETYAGSNYNEYFATGMQFFLNAVSGFKVTPKDSGFTVKDRETLKQYDPDLFNLIQETFSCDSKWIERCDYNGRKTPACKMYCAVGPDSNSERCTGVPASERKPCGPPGDKARKIRSGCCYDDATKKAFYPRNDCKDMNLECAMMAEWGHCASNPVFTYINCPFSCGTCEESKAMQAKYTKDQLNAMCHNTKRQCNSWKRSGMCTNAKYKSFMSTNCKMACTGCKPPSYPFS